MSMDVADIGSGSKAAAGLDPAAEALARAERSQAKSEALIKEIRDKGFRAYMEDMEREKLRALREKILQTMGFSEDDLARMPSDQRAAVEKAVNEEIRRRLMASAAVKEDGGGMFPVGGLPKGLAAFDSGAGLGPLLAVQERDAAAPPTHRRKDETAG